MRKVLATVLIAVFGVVVAGCADDSTRTTDHPAVVASTDVWAAVARAVGGEHADVTALFNSPGADPHEFEPSMADTAKIEDADVLVFNGGHYDAYVETAASSSAAVQVNATRLAGGEDDHEDDDHGHDDHGHEGHGHEGHDHGTNEHVFYDLPVVARVADATADALAKLAPMHAQYYRDRAAAFDAGIADLRGRLAALKAQHDGTEVAATEPLAAYLLTAAGLVDVAPAAFTAAVENGQAPSAADVAAFGDLITGRDIAVLIYNTQAVDPATRSVLDLARSNAIPVVDMTESLPAGVTDYLLWQSAQIDRLEAALAR